MPTAFRGMRGNNGWVADQRPKNWRDMILSLYPNGDAPLTALMSKAKSQSTDDPQFHWWTKMFVNQSGTITGIYKNANLTTGTGAASITDGMLLYVKVAETVAKHFREGHQVLIRHVTDFTKDCNGKVTQVVLNGAHSYIVFKALQTSAGDPDTDFNRIMVIGSVNPEGGVMPDAITYDPEKWFNYTQIFRTPLSITRTAMKTRLRTGDQYQQAKAEALEMHSVEMERAMLFGYPTEKIGKNGQPERTTMGMIPFITGIDNAAFAGYPSYGTNKGIVGYYPTDKAGTTWLNGGIDWIEEKLERLFRYGGPTRTAFTANKTLMYIGQLIKNTSTYNIESGENEYGMKVRKWMTPYGDVDMITHPLFNLEPTLRQSMLLFEPDKLIYRYIDDTDFYGDELKQNTGRGRIDGKDEEWLTEAGLEFHHPISAGFLTGFGRDGTIIP